MRDFQETDGLATRIAMLISDSSANAFAQKCGFSEGSIRQYLNGTIPRMDKVVTMARTAGVRLEWLATGEGPMKARDATTLDGISEPLLASIIEAVLTACPDGGPTPSPSVLARIIAQIYGIIATLDLSSEAERRAATCYALELERRNAQIARRRPGNSEQPSG